MSFSQGSVQINQKKAASSPVTAGARNGLTISSGYVELGGSNPLIQTTSITVGATGTNYKLQALDDAGAVLFMLDRPNNTYTLGNATKLNIDDADSGSFTATATGGRMGLSLAYASGLYQIGDINNIDNQTKIIVNDATASKNITYQAPTAHIWKVGAAGATEAMRIISSGNLGIGTNNPTGKLQIYKDNTDSTNTAGAGSHIFLDNPNATGQTVLYSQINGALMAKWRTDYVGNINWVSAANSSSTGHVFFINGDFPGGTIKAVITNAGMALGGITTPLAQLHLAAGTASANTAPLKLTTGTNLTSAEAGAIEYTTPRLFFTNGGGQRQEIPQIQQSRVTSQFDKTSDTTLANITGLSSTLVAGKIYRFVADLFTSSNVAGGVKFAIAGTATATAIIYEAVVFNGAAVSAQTRATALATAVGGVTAVTAALCRITGLITVNAAGTLTVQFAQNASNGSASSVLIGSYFEITEMV